MVLLIALFACVFMVLLAALQVALSSVGIRYGGSFYEFYPIMAGLGAIVGFERWWSQELGDYNPFHDT
jgi:hypothetical protein